MIHSEQVATPDEAENDEKIGIKKIRLMKSAVGTVAVVGSFATADNYLMAWCSSSKGWLTCEFEVEYLDGHILKGAYRKYRRKSGRLSLSNHIRSAFRSTPEGSSAAPRPKEIFDDNQIQLWKGNCPSSMNADFLKRYEIVDWSGS